MQRSKAFLTGAFAVLAAVGVASSPAPAQQAQQPAAAPYGAGAPVSGPMYNKWNAGWDHNVYDHRHVILGRVVGFQPYRIQLRRPNGTVQSVDLKNGTVIRPMGSTPAPGQRVALVGYYSGGTFIVNRLLFR